MTSADATTLRMLIERLNWPIRKVRLLAAKEFGHLLESPDHSKAALDIFLGWLASCRFESQVVSGLVVLLATCEDVRPACSSLTRHIPRPSILAALLLERIYGAGQGRGNWRSAHSGVVPSTFEPERYFWDHLSTHVPPIMGNRLRELEERTGLPFMKQWAYEWRNLMDATGSPLSEFPYHFVEVSQARSGIIGQISAQQCEVYRSAFLRTLACAVDRWRVPAQEAALHSTLTLPANRGLLGLEPVQRPQWLADLPEKCCEPDAPLEQLGKELLRASNQDPEWRLVSLRTPIARDVARYAELSISGILATEDFQPASDAYTEEGESRHAKMLLWLLKDGLTFEGALDMESIPDFASPGRAGDFAPACLSVWPLPSGFWHGDLFQVGLTIPAPYLFETPISLSCVSDAVVASATSGGERVGSSCMWHDHWTPLHPPDGPTRCGVLTLLKESHLAAALKRHKRRLQWMIDLRVWKQAAEYEPFELTKRCAYFDA
jgi:hypothetical protein